MALFMAALSVARAASFNNPTFEDSLSGKYEGVAKSDSMGEIPLKVELKNDNGKVTGTMEIPNGTAPITGGTYADGKLTMKFDAGGQEGTVTATVSGDKITGKWELSGQGGTLELKKIGVAASNPPKMDTAKPVAGDPVSGEWDATADAQGNTVPFTLKLKLEGDKVTGSSESAMGNAAITKGAFAGGKLSFTLEIPQGAISFTGMVKEGKINGEFEIPGMGAGKWEAKKK
jgi:hypothetical protein